MKMRILAKEYLVAATLLGGTLGVANTWADEPAPPPAGEGFPSIRTVFVFRDSEYGGQVHYGMPDSPGKGYPHYDGPSEHYGHWYRPKAFGFGYAERCQPRPFRPRGLGNLGNKPSTCYRVDYHPFVLKDANNRFGPSYFARPPDPRCQGIGCLTPVE